MTPASLMHGVDWQPGQDVSGWLCQEKLDGVRVLWDGSKLWTRHGLPINPPAGFIADLPAFPLDCELWAGRGGFVTARNAAVYDRFAPGVRLAVFDAPSCPGGYLDRLAAIPDTLGDSAFKVPVWTVASIASMIEDCRRIQAEGGEGLMLRKPFAPYRAGRSASLLKFKG